VVLFFIDLRRRVRARGKFRARARPVTFLVTATPI
jgi:hypothetical protein